MRGCGWGGEALTPMGACPRPRQHPPHSQKMLEEEGAPHGALSPQGAPRAWGDPARPVLPIPAPWNEGRLGAVQHDSRETLTPGVPSAMWCGTAWSRSAWGCSRGMAGTLRARGEVPERARATSIVLPRGAASPRPGARGGLLWQDGATPTPSPGVPGWFPAHLGRARCERSGGTGAASPAARRGQRHGAARQAVRMEVLCLLLAALCAAAPGPGMAPSPASPPASSACRGCHRHHFGSALQTWPPLAP